LERTGGVAEPHSHVALGFSRGSLQDVSLVGDLPLHDALGDRETPFLVKVRSHLVKPQQGAVLGRPLHAPAEAAVLGKEGYADAMIETQVHQVWADVYRSQANDRFQVV
jgi:hypothetical protein